MFCAVGGIDTMVGGPFPMSWYARRAPLELANRIGGFSMGIPEEVGVRRLDMLLEAAGGPGWVSR